MKVAKSPAKVPWRRGLSAFAACSWASSWNTCRGTPGARYTRVTPAGVRCPLARYRFATHAGAEP
eukprot:1561912-Pyramimonas_sp.AAC.1